MSVTMFAHLFQLGVEIPIYWPKMSASLVSSGIDFVEPGLFSFEDCLEGDPEPIYTELDVEECEKDYVRGLVAEKPFYSPKFKAAMFNLMRDCGVFVYDDGSNDFHILPGREDDVPDWLPKGDFEVVVVQSPDDMWK